MRLLEKLAAWYLRGKATGIVYNLPATDAAPPSYMTGWIYGNGWYITFPKVVSK